MISGLSCYSLGVLGEYRNYVQDWYWSALGRFGIESWALVQLYPGVVWMDFWIGSKQVFRPKIITEVTNTRTIFISIIDVIVVIIKAIIEHYTLLPGRTLSRWDTRLHFLVVCRFWWLLRPTEASIR